jgi:hypothetical protein
MYVAESTSSNLGPAHLGAGEGAVLDSVTSPHSKRAYARALQEFFGGRASRTRQGREVPSAKRSSSAIAAGSKRKVSLLPS